MEAKAGGSVRELLDSWINGGIFSGMNSLNIPTQDGVLADLGNAFVHSFIDSVDGARGDLAEFREWKPDWQGTLSSRFVANLLHERIWGRLVREVQAMDDIDVKDREPIRELRNGSYLIRIKRHHLDDRISSYATVASSEFWAGSTNMLEGLESYSLALGYYWDPDLAEVGDAVLSFRDGTHNAIWAIKLRRDAGEVTGFVWTPIEPQLPDFDLSEIVREAEEESGS